MERSTIGARALITAPHFTRIPGEHQQLLDESGLVATITDHDIDHGEQLALIEQVRPQVAVIGDDVWDEVSFALAKSLGLVCVSRHGTGVHPAMLAAAAKLGIGLANTPGTTQTPVSELAAGLIFAALRSIPARNAELNAGHWNRVPGEELRGKTVLVFGSGCIGTATAQILLPFGADVTLMSRECTARTLLLCEEYARLKHHQDFQLLPQRYGTLAWRPASDLYEALENADVVVLLVPLTAETEGIVDSPFLDAMKFGSLLVSISRGALIADEQIIVDALARGRLGRFATDVFVHEPLHDTSDSPYLALPAGLAERVVCLPHVGWLTTQNVERQLLAALKNVIAGFTGRPQNAMNWVVPMP